MKYSGTIIWHLISVIFSLVLLNTFYSDFEVVVIAVLVIIWSSVNQGFAALDLSGGKRFLLIFKKMVESKNLKNKPISDEKNDELDLEEENGELDFDGEKLGIEETERLIQELTVKFYISVASNTLTWIVAIFKILGSI